MIIWLSYEMIEVEKGKKKLVDFAFVCFQTYVEDTTTSDTVMEKQVRLMTNLNTAEAGVMMCKAQTHYL